MLLLGWPATPTTCCTLLPPAPGTAGGGRTVGRNGGFSRALPITPRPISQQLITKQTSPLMSFVLAWSDDLSVDLSDLISYLLKKKQNKTTTLFIVDAPFHNPSPPKKRLVVCLSLPIFDTSVEVFCTPEKSEQFSMDFHFRNHMNWQNWSWKVFVSITTEKSYWDLFI